MPKRVHVTHLTEGVLTLEASEAHHLRDVLRLTAGTDVDLFDGVGRQATGRIVTADSEGVTVETTGQIAEAAGGLVWTVASAVPKAARADWLAEKLSELGTSSWVLLSTERSVVHPEGKNKIDRWRRIAQESAKQCRRPGVMEVSELVDIRKLVPTLTGATWFLSTEADAIPIAQAAGLLTGSLTMLIGPEGGWSPEELSLFKASNFTGVRLTSTILRVETAAVAAAAVVACLTLSERNKLS